MLKSPLRWAGSKAQLVAPILTLIGKPERYIEPFVGSGSIALNVDAPKKIIADLNPDLMNFYKFSRKAPVRFRRCAEQLLSSRCGEEDYYLLRKEFNQAPYGFQRAVLFFYLNRMCFNGLCRFNESGMFNVPFGGNRNHDPSLDTIAALAHSLRGASIRTGNYAYTVGRAREGDVIYLDPPYLGTSTSTKTFAQYMSGGFDLAEHMRLAANAEAWRRRGALVIVSNHDTKAIRELYRGAHLHSFDVRRTISCKGYSRGQIAEIVAVYQP